MKFVLNSLRSWWSDTGHPAPRPGCTDRSRGSRSPSPHNRTAHSSAANTREEEEEEEEGINRRVIDQLFSVSSRKKGWCHRLDLSISPSIGNSSIDHRYFSSKEAQKPDGSSLTNVTVCFCSWSHVEVNRIFGQTKHDIRHYLPALLDTVKHFSVFTDWSIMKTIVTYSPIYVFTLEVTKSVKYAPKSH